MQHRVGAEVLAPTVSTAAVRACLPFSSLSKRQTHNRAPSPNLDLAQTSLDISHILSVTPSLLHFARLLSLRPCSHPSTWPRSHATRQLIEAEEAVLRARAGLAHSQTTSMQTLTPDWTIVSATTCARSKQCTASSGYSSVTSPTSSCHFSSFLLSLVNFFLSLLQLLATT